MVDVGDRVRMASSKGPHREGAVTRVSGALLTVRWLSGDETTVVPAPGALTVIVDTDEAAKPNGKKRRAADGSSDQESESGKDSNGKKGKKAGKRKKHKHG